MTEYNPFKDFNPAFTQYQYLETPKVTFESPFGNIDFSDGFIQRNGTYIAPPNTPETQEYVTNNYDDLFKEMGDRHSEISDDSSKTIEKNVQGNKKRAMEFFQSKGLNAHQAAGIVGNLLGESNLNPEAVNPTSKAYGIAQWLGDRKKKLIAKYGNKPTFEQQLEFVWEELNSSEKSAYNKLLQTKNVDEAINSFMKHFERPSQREMAQSITNRLKYGRGLLS